MSRRWLIAGGAAIVLLALALGWRARRPESVSQQEPPAPRWTATTPAPALPTEETSEPVAAADAVTLSGHVEDSGGGPIAAAQIVAVAPRATALRGDRPRTFATRADGGGRYRVVLARGTYDVTGRADGYAPATLRGLPVTADLTRNIRLHPAARLEGRVVERDGRPVPDAEVRLQQGREAVARTTAGEDGAFVFTPLDPGSYDVVAVKPPLAGRAPAPVDVTVAAQAAVVVVVVPRPALRGRVSSGGRPVAGAEISAGFSPEPAAALQRATSGADGRFAIGGLLPGDYWLWTAAPGSATDRRLVSLVDVDRELEIVLTAEAVLTGVVLAGGKPAAGVPVRVEVADRQDKRGMLARAETTADGEGRFRLGLPAGQALVEASHAERGSARAELDLAAGQTREVRLTLGAAHVVGRVRWSDGAPAATVIVRGFLDESASRATLTGAQGEFRLGPFAAGTVRVVASRGDVTRPPRRPGAHWKEVTVASDADAGVLILERGGLPIRGVVVDPEGQPAAGAFVRERGVPEEVITALDGRFIVEGARGPTTLVARQPGYPESTAADVAPGSEVKIQLRAGGVLAGRVMRAGDQPITAFTLALFYSETAQPTAERQALRDAPLAKEFPFDSPSGAFELRGIAPDTYDLVATAVGEPGTAGRLGRLTVAAGEQKRGLRVVAGGGAAVTGRLVEESGAPIADARLVLDTPGKSPNTRSDAAGAFTLRGVVPGQRLRVDVRAAGHPPHAFFVQVPEGAAESDVGPVRVPR